MPGLHASVLTPAALWCIDSGMTKKEATLILRVDSATKQRIQDAARQVGKSATSLVLEATLGHVEKIEQAPPRKVSRGACPSFFRALCQTATAGGTGGYAAAGYELARHLGEQAPDEIEHEEWGRRLHALNKLIREADDDPLIEWFEENVPRCLSLVPPRRHRNFLDGVRDYVKDHGRIW